MPQLELAQKFTPEAVSTIAKGVVIARDMEHKSLSPGHIALALLRGERGFAFGDTTTRSIVESHLIGWENALQRTRGSSRNNSLYIPGTGLRTSEDATIVLTNAVRHAQESDSNANGKASSADLLFAILDPEGNSPYDPFFFISGHADSAGSYRQVVAAAAGSRKPINPWFDSEEYKLAKKGIEDAQIRKFQKIETATEELKAS